MSAACDCDKMPDGSLIWNPSCKLHEDVRRSLAQAPGSDAPTAPLTPEEQEELRRLLEWFKASEKDKTMWDKSPYHPNAAGEPQPTCDPRKPETL
jgi:hypothetical protein